MIETKRNEIFSPHIQPQDEALDIHPSTRQCFDIHSRSPPDRTHKLPARHHESIRAHNQQLNPQSSICYIVIRTSLAQPSSTPASPTSTLTPTPIHSSVLTPPPGPLQPTRPPPPPNRPGLRLPPQLHPHLRHPAHPRTRAPRRWQSSLQLHHRRRRL